MNEPSVDANVFSSRRKNMLELTKRAPPLSAAALAASRRPTLSSIAMLKGSTSIGVRHVPSGVGVTGASTTGRTSVALFAFACAAACRATRATSSREMSRLAANPQAPFTIARTPKPRVSLSVSPCTRCSRVKSSCVRLCAKRTSA
jgi:hypothetical protein